MGFESYLGSSILAFLFGHTLLYGGEAVYAPSPMFLALHRPDGYELLGIANQGYERVELPFSTWGWSSNGTISNEVAISFPEATADWLDMINSWSLIDGVTGYGLLSGFFNERPVVIARGDIPIIVEDQLQITLDGTALAGGFNDFAEDILLNHFFGKAAWLPPSSVWVGLLTAYPGEDASNASCNEVTAASYSRVETWPAWWEMGSADDCWNRVEIAFPTAEEDWGVVDHYAIFNTGEPTSPGFLLIHGPVSPPKLVLAGSEPRFDALDPGPPLRIGIDMGIIDLEV